MEPSPLADKPPSGDEDLAPSPGSLNGGSGIHKHIHTHRRRHIRIDMYINLEKYIDTRIYIYVCTYLRAYIRIAYVHTCIHIYITYMSCIT